MQRYAKVVFSTPAAATWWFISVLTNICESVKKIRWNMLTCWGTFRLRWGVPKKNQYHHCIYSCKSSLLVLWTLLTQRCGCDWKPDWHWFMHQVPVYNVNYLLPRPLYQHHQNVTTSDLLTDPEIPESLYLPPDDDLVVSATDHLPFDCLVSSLHVLHQVDTPKPSSSKVTTSAKKKSIKC